VHEILSHEAGDDVPFVDIARPLVRMVEEGLLSPDLPIEIKITGDAGNLPATIATPLAVVLNELLQNVVDHAYPLEERRGRGPGHVLLDLDNDGTELRVSVTDDGVGLPAGFSVDASTGLGLSIVRTLVTSELDGTIEFAAGAGDGDWPGTVVELRVPIGAGDLLGDDEPASGLDAQRPPEAEGR
jgi:two-component sensor histidine kinase